MKKTTSKTTKPINQQNKQKITPQKQQTTSQKYRRIPRVSLEIISFLIGLAGIFFVVYPRFSVSSGTPLDVHNPFKTPFIIKNDGYLPMFNVKYSLTAEKMVTDVATFTNCGFSNNNIIEKLSSNKSSTLFVDRIFSMPPNSVKSAIVFINVTYRPFLVPFTFTENIRFKTEINTKNEYVWFEYYDK